MKILMISYIPLEKEGRFQRCYDYMHNNYDIFVVDTGEEFLNDKARISIGLKGKGLRKYFDFYCKALKIVKDIDFDVIYAHNYYCAQLAVKLSKKYNKPIIYDAYELYYPEAKKSFSMRDRFFYFQEKKAVKKSSAVIAASYERALIMLGHYNIKNIPCVIENMPYSFENVQLPKKEKNNEKIKIVYAGFLSNGRSIMELVEAINNSDCSDKIELDVYGAGPLEEELSEVKYEFFKFCGRYNNAELKNILSKYDIGFISYMNYDLNNIFCCPNKVYDYVCSGLVLLAPYNEGLNRIISTHGIGVCNNDLTYAIKECTENYLHYRSNIESFIENHKESDNPMVIRKIINQLENE